MLSDSASLSCINVNSSGQWIKFGCPELLTFIDIVKSPVMLRLLLVGNSII